MSDALATIERRRRIVMEARELAERNTANDGVPSPMLFRRMLHTIRIHADRGRLVELHDRLGGIIDLSFAYRSDLGVLVNEIFTPGEF